jgi:hypothetical protein
MFFSVFAWPWLRWVAAALRAFYLYSACAAARVSQLPSFRGLAPPLLLGGAMLAAPLWREKKRRKRRGRN